VRHDPNVAIQIQVDFAFLGRRSSRLVNNVLTLCRTGARKEVLRSEQLEEGCVSKSEMFT
jgi:hypothetical protein